MSAGADKGIDVTGQILLGHEEGWQREKQKKNGEDSYHMSEKFKGMPLLSFASEVMKSPLTGSADVLVRTERAA